MSGFFSSILKRIISIIITMFIVTAVLYAAVMLTPAESRAELYIPKNSNHQTEAQYQKLVALAIEKNHLNDPYPLQYYYWISNLTKGNWGYSPTLKEDVLTAIIERTPVTAELALYSILLFFPLGILCGILAAYRQHKPFDIAFRLTAYIATTLPPFILALVLMAFFYIGLYWFAPERTSTAISLLVNSGQFRQFTGLLTIDGLLNHRPDVTLDALRHLAMPVFTLAFAHWATLARITRVSMINELQQDYVVAAKSRGIRQRTILWHHALPNAIAPSLTSSMLSAASLLTGVFVVEIIFDLRGISDIAVHSLQYVPDAPAALGFAVYSVLIVLVLMFLLDIIQLLIDPRKRREL